MNAESPIAPPHALEAEQTVLGLCMWRADTVADFAAMLTPEMFHDPLHADIFTHIVGRYQAGEPYSTEYIMRDMRGDARWNEIPVGIKYLQALRNEFIPMGRDWKPQAQPLAELIIEAARRRTLITVTDEFGDDLRNKPDVASTDMANRFQAAVDGVQEGFAGDVKREGSIRNEVVAYATASTPPRVSTGLASLDAVIGGYERGTSTVIGGRPSMGKSALGLYSAYKAAQRGENVVFLSLEMSLRQVGFRLASMHLAENTRLRVPYQLIRTKGTALREWSAVCDALEEIERLPIRVIKANGMTIDGIRADVMRHRGHLAVRGQRLDLVVVDYLQFIQWAPGEKDAIQATNKISRGLKNMAAQLDVPVVTMAQLSRAVEQRQDKRPMLSDLRESGTIEQDADVIIFAFREHYYRRNETELTNAVQEADRRASVDALKHKFEAVIAKQRDGDVRNVDLGCDMGLNTFWDIERPQAERDLI